MKEQEIQENMNKSIEATQRSFNTIRTGRANASLVERINVPPLTEERRKEFCKLASKYAEEGKVALRNIRRDAVDKEKKDEKDGLISIDESRDNQSEIQKITDKYIALIETKLSEKEKEILKVW